MKFAFLPGCFALVLGFVAPLACAADAKSELNDLVGRVQKKIDTGARSEDAFTAELKEFDDLTTAHQSEKSDDVAQIIMMKAMLYAQVFRDSDKAKGAIQQIKRDFPETSVAKQADAVLAQLAQEADIQKIAAQLKPSATFPDFQEKDVDGKPLSLSALKGKVVLIDFWATWCGPCVQEFPNVLKTYKKYHDQGFEIIGISLDEDRSDLDKFIKERGVVWAQYFDGKGWENKLARKYGVTGIPATYLIDKEGKIIATELRGEALDAAVAKALK